MNLPIAQQPGEQKERKKLRSRFVRDRKNTPRIYITERDLDILATVDSYRFLTTRQIERLFFGSSSHACRRLFLLWQNRLLERLFQPVVAFEGSSSAIYALAAAGAKLLEERRGVDPASLQPITQSKARRSAYFLDHTLRRNDFRICLELACRDSEDLELLFWRQRKEEIRDAIFLRTRPGQSRRVPLVADGFFGLRVGEKRFYFLVEIDRGTETVGHVSRKLKGYYTWWKERGHEKRFAVTNIRILVVTTKEKRHENLVQAAYSVREERRGTGLIWLTTDEHATLDDPGRVLDRIWQKAKAGDDNLYSLVE
jgi:hypothetical protein